MTQHDKRQFWDNLDFKLFEEEVKQKQREVVEAYTSKDFAEVKRLQRRIVASKGAAVLAVRDVYSNQVGKKLGTGRNVLTASSDCYDAMVDLHNMANKPERYVAGPLKEVLITESGTKEKQLYRIPRFHDQCVQALYLFRIAPVIECQTDPRSFGFRKGRTLSAGVVYLKTALHQGGSAKTIFKTGIENCFDEISHAYLMENVVISDQCVLSQWLKTGVFQIGEMYDPNRNIRILQEGVITPALCNVALEGIEDYVRNSLRKRAARKGNLYVVRYAGEVVIAGPHELLKQAEVGLNRFLEDRGLDVKAGKRQHVRVYDGFTFLGFYFGRRLKNFHLKKFISIDPDVSLGAISEEYLDTHLVVKPREQRVKRIKSIFQEQLENRSSLDVFIQAINPELQSWYEYYRIRAYSADVFKEVGDHFDTELWKWCRQRHPKWPISKTFRTYIQMESKNFFTWGKKKEQTLVRLNSNRCLVYPNVKLVFNPYTLEGEEYLAERARYLAKQLEKIQ